MKKNILTLGLLALCTTAGAQVVSHVGNDGIFYVGENALVYNGGGMQTKGTGKYEIRGNMMVVGTGTDVIQTQNADGTSSKTTGGNIVLKLNDPDNYTSSTYGQLYIQGLAQTNLTGIVDKEYLATKNGVMQQMALPFYDKTFASLATDLGITGGFSNQRTTSAVGYWENARVVMHNIPGTSTTLQKADKDNQTVTHNNAARYYAVGTANWNPEQPIIDADYYTISGRPFSDATPISYTLSGAGYDSSGTAINYGGGNGAVINTIYNERYNSYLQDAFDGNSQGSWKGTFGRNIYQFGNPFLTNIDLSTIGYNERTAGGDDGNNISSIQAVRYESGGVTKDENNGTKATSYKFISYSDGGIPTGDFGGAIIKPMQAFVIKLRNNTSAQTLNFNTLRRFAYSPRDITNGQATNPNTVTTNRSASTGSIKQLRVIGLDSSGNEVMRTYFVVGSSFVTGHNADAKMQVSAYSGDLSTREELPAGGEDTQYSNSYWLYINEANEQDFLGKRIKMVANTAKIAAYKFQIAENAVELQDGEGSFADGGQNFYIEQTPGQLVAVAHNQVLPALANVSGLYYGRESVLGTDNTAAQDELKIAYEEVSKTHQVIFPASWKKATVNIYDLSGKLIVNRKELKTANNFTLPLTIRGVYMVEAISEAGVKVVKKVIK